MSRRAALALATVLMSLVAAAAVHADDPPATTTQITSGSLNWGVKASFRRYVGAAGITVADGVTRTDDATPEFPVPGFTWPLTSGTYDAATKATTLQFGGSVRFLAHEGALDVTIKNPKLVLTGAESTLYANVHSRPMEGGEVTDYGVVPVVSLDLDGKDPAVTASTTTWPALTSYLTGEAAPAFAGFYSVSTELDPVSATYEGSGGKATPTAEAWDLPNTPKYEQQLVKADGQATSVWPSADGTLLFVVQKGSGAIRALDATTLEPVGAPAPVTRPEDLFNGHSAFDAIKNAVFVQIGQQVHELAWQADSKSFTDTVLPGADVGGTYSTDMAYSAGAQLLVRFESGNMQAWHRDGASWTRSDYKPDFPSSTPRIAVDADGTVLVASAGNEPRQITLYAAPSLLSRTLADSYTDPDSIQPGQFDQPNLVTLGPDGTASFTSYTSRVWSARKGSNGLYQLVGPSVSHRVGNAFDSATDPVDGTVLIGIQGANRLAAVRDGALAGFTIVPKIGSPDWPYGYMGIAADVQHNAYINSSDAAQGGLWKLKRLGLSPSFTAQPQDATTTLGLGEASKAVSFSAAVDGTPAPTLKWQTRAGSADRWADVPGATGTTLTLTATVAESGLQARAIATNAAGALASTPATLDVQAAPAVVAQPDPQTTTAGQAATFKVMPSGSPYPAIQWQRLDAGGFWVNVEDATSGVLTIDDTAAAMSGTTLRARLRNTYGTVYSRPVTLTVKALVTGPVVVTGGHLDWGVKASFRTYVRGPIAHGDYATDGGATENADGTLRFPATGGTYDATTGKATIKLGGSVRFTGHDGQLDMTFAALRAEFDGQGGGTLYADAVSRPNTPGGQPQSYPGVALATLDAASATLTRGDDAVAWSGVGATLTEAGAPAFGGFYQAGQALDPLALAITTGGPAPTEDPDDGGDGDGTEKPPTTPTPAPVTPPTAILTGSATPTAKVTRRPTVSTAKGRARIGRSRVVTVATVRCLDGPCTITAPKAVRAKAGGKVVAFTVLRPAKALKTGTTGAIRIRVTAAVAKRLQGHTAKLSIKVTSRAGGRTTTVTVHPQVTAA